MWEQKVEVHCGMWEKEVEVYRGTWEYIKGCVW